MNVYHTLNEAVNKGKDRLAFWSSEKKLCFTDLRQAVNAFAQVLVKAGFQPGDRLVIWSWNDVAAAVAILSAWCLKGVVVPLDAGAKVSDVAGLIKHAEANFLITPPRREEILAEIKKKVNKLKIFFLEDVFSSPLVSKLEFPSPDETAPAIILYTSGTTGTPKGVLLTYRHLDSPLMTLNHFQYIAPNDVFLGTVPFSHLGGIVGLLLPIAFGTPLIVLERFIPKLFLKYITQHKVTGFFVPPTILQTILLQKELDPNILKSVRWIASFGAPCPPALFKAFGEKFPWIDLITGYGLSESAAPNVLMPRGLPLEKKLKPGILGKPAPWVEVRIVNDQGETLPPGEIGEILLKGWFVMAGYYKAPELTQEVIKDGWLYTGDLGYLDEEGFLYITGRKKEIIIVGGLNVYANEVEFVIQEHPGVAEVAVVGVPDGIRGEVVKAVIVPKSGYDLTAQEIINFCRKRLASYKLPKIVEFRDSLPRTSSGKIAKAQLRT
jgi:acyl-CoA synthetase (AMP-forming)/AMP-acid ligase II